MDKREIIEKAKRYSKLVTSILPVEQIILYGSCAKNTHHEYSDIDIAVVVDEIPDSDFLNMSARLFKLSRQVDAMIEPVLIESCYDPSGFLAQIRKEGQVIYGIRP